MYLKSLTLKGFKSFADKTQMSFDPGLNVVVGPNGSGKSNVSDSVLWVLGEQSAKMLRGQAMEDVIFSGSSARQPVGVAEVTLVLDNQDRTLPIDFAEVGITRRMYRSGESEYLINGSPARLRDIQDILHDSGLGKDTHSIISQGKLDSILQGRPEERRELIEEAAGISKHRRRKERAERKLAAMDVNLTRAKDVQREITRQLRPLEKQVDQARRHRDLAEQLTALRTTLAVDDLRQLQSQYRALSAQGREADAAVELAKYRYDERAGELDRYQSLLEQKGIFVGDLDEQRRRMQDLLGRMDSDMRLLEEKGKNMVSRLSEMRMRLSSMEKQRNDAEREHAGVAEDLVAARAAAEELRRSVNDLQKEADAASKRRRELGAEFARTNDEQRRAQRTSDEETLAYAKLRDQIESAEAADEMYAGRLERLAEQIGEAESALGERTARKVEAEETLAAAKKDREAASHHINAAQEALTAARKNESELRRALSSAQADLGALEALDRANENKSQLVAALADGGEKDRIRCRLADLIEVPAELEGVVEALLADDLTALVVEGANDAAALADAAAASKAEGTATIVAGGLDNDAAPDADDLPGTALVDSVKARAGYEDVVTRLFGRVRLVRDANEALVGHSAHAEFTYVTAGGAYLLPDGRMRVGAVSTSEHGALDRKRRIRSLRAELPEHETAVEQAAAATAEAEAALAAARDERAAAEGEVARLNGELKSLTSELGRLSAQRDSAKNERAQVEKTRATAAEKIEKARTEVKQHRDAAHEAADKAAELSRRLDEINQERGQASAEERDKSSQLSDGKLKLATTIERRNHLESREKELARTAAQLAERIEATTEASRSLDVVSLRVEPLHKRYEAVRERALWWAGRLKDRASLAEADSDSLKKTISEAKEAVDKANGELERAKEAASAVKVELTRIEVEVKHAIEAITSTGAVLEEALELPAPDDREATERQAARVQRQLEQMGPVNEVAMDEYDRLKQRADYITAQVDDLERAHKALGKITAAIERKMRHQFLVVFDQVNSNFSEVFSLLFPGGHAYLEMTDPDHPGETGIEIQAQPRGKRITKMMLMSGGEKSLTALALLFAVYKTRTVPFYIFDEVEAALDDANLSKLLDAIDQLKETTQLIVITHQRRTMESADVLYGVSMRADGVSHVVSQRLDKATGKVVDA